METREEKSPLLKSPTVTIELNDSSAALDFPKKPRRALGRENTILLQVEKSRVMKRRVSMMMVIEDIDHERDGLADERGVKEVSVYLASPLQNFK